MSVSHNPTLSGVRLPPQIVLLMSDSAEVLSVNRALAGTSFESVSGSTTKSLHEQLHPNCDDSCRFDELWARAWASLPRRETIEWEVSDSLGSRILRLNLARTLRPDGVKDERRQPQILLTVTDVTRYRREYEALVERQRQLIEILSARRLPTDEDGETVSWDIGETGRHLVRELLPELLPAGRELVLAQEAERKRIAAELHDGIAQTIGIVKYRMEAAIAQLAQANPSVDLGDLHVLPDELRGLVDEIRRITRNLAPSLLEDFGLQVALDWLTSNFVEQHQGVQLHLTCRFDESAVSDFVKLTIYRIAQEALSNISKHASADEVKMALRELAPGLVFSITDNGVGFDRRKLDDASRHRGYGLRSMRERVEATGGSFSIDCSLGAGVVITAEWSADEYAATR